MSVSDINKFKGHGGGSVNGILNTAGRTKTAVAPKRDKFKGTTTRASIHGTAKGRIPTVDHFIHVFNNRRTRMQCINHFFIMVSKNILQYTHKTIMTKNVKKRNP